MIEIEIEESDTSTFNFFKRWLDEVNFPDKRTVIWEYSKTTVIVRSAEEITGIKGIKEFEIKIDQRVYKYSSSMNKLAGQRIEIITSLDVTYDYFGASFAWLKNWLKSFEYELK